VKDYYKILEVSPDASLEEIKQQWRFLAQVWHPDRFANLEHKRQLEEKFNEIHEAYAVLSKPQERQAYNAWRSAAGYQYAVQAARAEDTCEREELDKYEEAAWSGASEEPHQREHVNMARRRAEDERRHTPQIQAASNLVAALVLYWVCVLACFWLIVRIYEWLASYF
jgi:DnaJ-class molecular chaperone